MLVLAVVCSTVLACGFEAPDALTYIGDGGQNMLDGAVSDGFETDADNVRNQGPCEPAEERCNGQDDDCDGQVDENLPGAGDPCVLNVGLCEAMGYQLCTPTEASEDFLSCRIDTPAPGPQNEVCDGLDNDCDGSADERLERACYDGPGRTVGRGECTRGTQSCQDSMWGACTSQVLPSQEVCNERDDDCDGDTDEGLTRSCYSGPAGTENIGECESGTQRCREGVWQSCRSEDTPEDEKCDGDDNDCDGSTDENLTRACYTGPAGTVDIGQCRSGQRLCTGGDWGNCVDSVVPAAEICNRIDDDCDGSTDETFAGQGDPCFDGIGACRVNGNMTCVDGKVECDATALAPRAELCDGLDNDCDGNVDETFDLVTRCIVGIGECARSAVPVCRDDGQGTRCPVSPGSPVNEGILDGGAASTCDGFDNDCDRRVDEQFLGCCIDGVLDQACITRNIPGVPP